MHYALKRSSTLVFLLARKFDNQNRVFRSQADKYDKPDLSQDVDRHAAVEQAGNRSEKAHGNDEYDRQRQRPTLVLSDEHKEHEQSGHAKNSQRRSSTLLLLIGQVGPFESDAVRQNPTRKLLHALKRRAGGDKRGRYTLHLSGRIQVIARYSIWNRVVPHLSHRSDRHHLSRGVSSLQPRDVVMISPEISVCLNHHLIRSAKKIEIVHVLRAQIHLQRGEHISWRQADFLGLYAIDVRVNRRRS